VTYKVWTILTIAMLSLPMKSYSLGFADIVDQTAVGPMLKYKPKHEYTPAIGIGQRITGLEINNTGSMTTTNRNSYLIGLDVDGSNSTVSIPFRDPKQSTESRVDSKLIYAGMSLNINPNIRFDANYDYTKGFLVEDSTVDRNPLYRFPDLSYEKIDFSLIYLKNPKHTSFLFSPILFRRSESSSSWMFSANVTRYHVANINSIQKYDLFKRDSDLTYSSIYTFTPGVAYSSNYFYKHFFMGGVIGVAYDFNYLQKNYESKSMELDSQTTASAIINLSCGYTWEQLTSGVYITSRSWYVDLDKNHLQNSHGKSGWYFSYMF